MFAENGFERTAAKDIARVAKTNAAAVNYYFGGIEGLYAQALQLARQRLFDEQAMLESITESDDPADTLRSFYRFLIGRILSSQTGAWSIRLLVREVIWPSSKMEIVLDRAGEPRRSFFAFLSRRLGLPEDDPDVARIAFSVAAPCLILLLADRRAIGQMFPGLFASPDAYDALIDHLTRYALAGIAAVEPQG